MAEVLTDWLSIDPEVDAVHPDVRDSLIDQFNARTKRDTDSLRDRFDGVLTLEDGDRLVYHRTRSELTGKVLDENLGYLELEIVSPQAPEAVRDVRFVIQSRRYSEAGASDGADKLDPESYPVSIPIGEIDPVPIMSELFCYLRERHGFEPIDPL